MATRMQLNEIWMARIVCTLGAQTSVNVRHYSVGNVVGNGCFDTDFVTNLDAALAADYKAVMTNEATYRGVSVQRIVPGPKTVPVFTLANTGTGSMVSDPLPKQCAGVISWKTSFSGHKYRGRTYIPFPSEAHSSAGGVPIGAYVTLLGNIRDRLVGSRNVSDGLGNSSILDPCIFHRLTNNMTLIMSGAAKSSWATQRRRGDYGKANLPPF